VTASVVRNSGDCFDRYIHFKTQQRNRNLFLPTYQLGQWRKDSCWQTKVEKNARLSVSYFLMPTMSVMANIKDDCCKLVLIWIHICNRAFQTWIVQGMHFQRCNENSFVRMWCIPNGFCINGKMSFNETLWCVGDV
jgi:hypothetical protein